MEEIQKVFEEFVRGKYDPQEFKVLFEYYYSPWNFYTVLVAVYALSKTKKLNSGDPFPSQIDTKVFILDCNKNNLDFEIIKEKDLKEKVVR
jgi:hypothetical protein